MILRAGLVFVALAGLSGSYPPASADTVLPMPVLALGSALSSSLDDLQRICIRLERFAGPSPRLPTTYDDEAFLTCQMSDGMIGLAYSDDALVLVQLRGTPLVERLTTQIEAAGIEIDDASVPYAGLDIFPSPALAVDPEGGRAWLLSPAHLHAHLFLFDQFELDVDAALSSQGADGQGVADALLPEGLEVGSELAVVRTVLSEHCPVYDERSISPPTLPGDLRSQVQIDCFGLNVAGFPRKAEFVFGDGRLDLIWILTGEEEQGRMRAYLSERYGQPVRETETYIVWGDGLVLRKDVPEVLMASPDVATTLTGP